MKLNSVTKVILATLVPYLYYYFLCKRNVLLRLKLKGKGGLDPATVTTDSKRKRYRIGAPKYFVKSTGESSHRLELDTSTESVDQNFPIITAYVDAYNKCCSQSNNNNLNCTSHDNKWFTRLMNKHPIVSSGQATLYWAHMRKAGGTSFAHAIESNAFQHTNESNALFTQGFGHTIKVHLQAGSRDCVDHTYANETLFVTILRNPVDRYVSEYFYSKVEKKLGSNTMRGRTLEWYDRSRSRNRGDFIKMSKARSDFIENWQTRWYTNPYHCEDLDRPMRMGHHGKNNYSYWRSGHGKDERMLVSRRDLLHAKIVLDKFDVVAIAPFFGEEAGECSIVPWLRLAGSNKPIAEVNEVRNNHSIKVKERKREKVKQAIWDNLGEHVKLDVELFEFAHELSNRRRAISCCVNEHAMANES